MGIIKQTLALSHNKADGQMPGKKVKRFLRSILKAVGEIVGRVLGKI